MCACFWLDYISPMTEGSSTYRTQLIFISVSVIIAPLIPWLILCVCHCVYMWLHVCVYVCLSVCVCVCVCVCACLHLKKPLHPSQVMALKWNPVALSPHTPQIRGTFLSNSSGACVEVLTAISITAEEQRQSEKERERES